MIRTCSTIFLAVALTLSAGCAGPGKSGQNATGAGAATGPGAYQIRSFETQTLPNGLQIIWVSDQALPYVSMQLLLKAGSAHDPKGKEGLAAFTGAMLEKGTTRRSATKISADLEQIGSGFSFDTQPDYGIAVSSALSFHKDNILNQFTEILFSPNFPAKELERQRELALAGMQKLADRPEDFTQYLLPKFIYGDHPYGHAETGSPASIRGIKRADLQKFYQDNFVPGRAVLAVVGQFDQAWKQKVIDTFSGWKGQENGSPTVPEVAAAKGTEILLVDRADLNQAQIHITYRGIPRAIPEYLELRAANKILGEGFGSRLFDEIRDRRGLTYGVNAWFDPRLQAGPAGIYTFTRIDKLGETVEETLNVYRRFVAQGVTDDEVRDVKALMRGQFPRTLETPEGLARQLLLLNLYGIPVDYLSNQFANIDAMTKESINATIKKYFDPQNLKILVYAPKAKADEILRRLGRVETRDYRQFLQ